MWLVSRANKASLIMKNIIKLFAIGCMVNILQAQPNYPKNPDEARLVYSDIENFVEAYSHFTSTIDSVEILKTYYFDKASSGLQEYIGRHNLTPELLNTAINKNPGRYAKIEKFVENIDNITPKINEAYQKFQKIIPNTMFPPTYLLVGANKGIAQASKLGQLVAITKVLDNDNKLTKLIIHELAHFQQAMAMGIDNYAALYAVPENMLGLCLREGGADFITFLTLGEVPNPASLEFLENNENGIKTKFINDLGTQDKSYWLWDSIGKKDTPHLLGYTIGYKICRSYYDLSEDHSKAIMEILSITQSNDFLEKSLYLKK